jgi:hypothetical protein
VLDRYLLTWQERTLDAPALLSSGIRPSTSRFESGASRQRTATEPVFSSSWQSGRPLHGTQAATCNLEGARADARYLGTSALGGFR